MNFYSIKYKMLEYITSCFREDGMGLRLILVLRVNPRFNLKPILRFRIRLMLVLRIIWVL